ncbi:MAG: hypothetical protein ACJ77K_06480 [Bacteroidia bacterium]
MTAVKKSKGKTREAKVIKLNAYRHPDQLLKAINGIWCTAHAALWPNQQFSAKEVSEMKRLISDHFRNGKAAATTFKELVERICLAKRYVARKRGRYISKPQDWLNIHYPLGLTGTEGWMEKVKAIRTDVPEYNQGITTLAKAVTAYIHQPTATTYYKQRRLLMEQKQFDLLQVFNSTIIHLQFSL